MHLRQEFINGHAADGSPHLGQILMENFNKPGDHIWQIDAGTGEVEMKSSVRSRSIQLARCLRNAGLKPGDVVAVSGVNRLNLHIPFYAGYLNGLPVSGIDPSFRYEEIKNMFRIIDPKLVFCEVFNVADYEKVVKDLGLDAKVVTFGGSEKSYAKFVHKFDENLPESEFKVAIFDANKVFGWLVSTSGTTGPPKAAAFSHTEIIKIIKITSIVKQKEIAPMLSMSSVQWISAYLSTMCMISANQIKVCTSAPITWEHVIDIINKYKPVLWTTCPFVLNNIMNHSKYCDLTCFTRLVVTGFAMNRAFLQKLKARIEPNGAVWVLFGQTECLGGVLIPAPDGPLGNCGKDFPLVPVQLVDTNTGEVITEPNRTGELWTKGPRLTEYYNNPEATAAAFSPDGWFKTGDLLYRDENGYYFFVERISSAFRCLSFFVAPMELEHVIQQHPDVVDVCVVGVPHPEDNMHPVACVQKRPGSTLTEQDVKDMITDVFSWEKHLHGGVIFVDDFPRTFSDKIARAKVRNYVLEHRRAACEYPSSGNTKKLISAFHRLSSTSNVRLIAV